MKIERKGNCKNCTRKFEWFYIVPQRCGSVLEVEVISKDKAGVYNVLESIENNGYKMPLMVTVYCPHCGCLNEIKVEYDK